MKDSKIGTLVDGERMTVVSGEGKKSRVVPHRYVSRRRVKIPIDVVLVARKGGKSWDRREKPLPGWGKE